MEGGFSSPFYLLSDHAEGDVISGGHAEGDVLDGMGMGMLRRGLLSLYSIFFTVMRRGTWQATSVLDGMGMGWRWGGMRGCTFLPVEGEVAVAELGVGVCLPGCG